MIAGARRERNEAKRAESKGNDEKGNKSMSWSFPMAKEKFVSEHQLNERRVKKETILSYGGLFIHESPEADQSA